MDGSEEFLSPTPCSCGMALERPPTCLEESSAHQHLWTFLSSQRLFPRLLPPTLTNVPTAPTPLPGDDSRRDPGRFDAGTICHACGDNYSHPALSLTVLSDEAVREAKISTASGGGEGVDHREPLAIIGGTGYVGRSLALHLLGHPTFRLGAVVGSSATVGKPFSAVFEKKEEALAEHYGADLWKRWFPRGSVRRVCGVDGIIERGECAPRCPSSPGVR